ncbi:MAG: hypothetical protein M1472_03220, partial [Planctomycetes bacterium]|nr:hypothetical protein [Planctomycetota bacterium]
GPLTGKPDAGNLLVRFGGRGGRNQPAFPTPILDTSLICKQVMPMTLLPQNMAASVLVDLNAWGPFLVQISSLPDHHFLNGYK